MRMVYRPDHPQANENGLVDAALIQVESVDAFHVISDNMEPTRHMATGEYFTSKSAFRRRTKDTGNIEYGNEAATLLKPRKRVDMSREQRRADIRRALRGEQQWR